MWHLCLSSSAISLSEIPLNKTPELPINPNNLYLMRFAYNTSELEVNRLNLTATVKKAKRQLKSNIVQAVKSLEQYEVAYEDIEALVRKKILKKS